MFPGTRALVYTLMAGVLIALAMVVSGPHIKASGTAWRASHRPVSDVSRVRLSQHGKARI